MVACTGYQDSKIFLSYCPLNENLATAIEFFSFEKHEVNFAKITMSRDKSKAKVLSLKTKKSKVIIVMEVFKICHKYENMFYIPQEFA